MKETEKALREQVKMIYVAYFGDCGLSPEEIDLFTVQFLKELVEIDFRNVGNLYWRIDCTNMLHHLRKLEELLIVPFPEVVNLVDYEKEK